ncbi:MAG: 50S ribosomal protein L6 [Candidatus Giovannonibacteria bacterium GW2011_GWA2_44_13b]|uniref:50S ribosomal protein L6 n=2 Tax=Candidatus Giovannoniibacteriota TaxID=1752738 RepID=A0A0G1H211_9BACT|nr:MAG: 50S ribosomal protein L6 [Candidatus Giovannonibacteria bacterium GW2011_GWA2_44_13b]OGF82674.1 MAG: 50S ribosomal protein L6 [Candidatus Giovannonibacteria bacterium RIFCSPLOWO2_01_FULL_44_16]
MSRLAKKPIIIPADVKVTQSGRNLVFHGPKGEVKRHFPESVVIKLEDASLQLTSKGEGKNNKALLGTAAAHSRAAIQGVREGYEKKLEVEGVGYKAQLDGQNLVFSLGFTHKVVVQPPKNITFKVEKNTITVTGIDKEEVGRISAEIRTKKPPEPYKGKGIHYLGEVIRRKAGKKAVSSA